MFLTLFVLSSKGSFERRRFDFTFYKSKKKQIKVVDLNYKQRFFLSISKFFVKYVKKRKIIKVRTKNKHFIESLKIKLFKIGKGFYRFKWLNFKYMRGSKKYKKGIFFSSLRLNKYIKLPKKIFKIKRKFMLSSVGKVVDLIKLRFFIFKLKFFSRVKLNFLYKRRFYKLLRLKFSFVKKVVRYWRTVIGCAFRRVIKFFISPAVGLVKFTVPFRSRADFIFNSYYRNLHYGVLNEFGYFVNKNKMKSIYLLNNFFNIVSGGFYKLKYNFINLLKANIVYLNKFIKRRIFLRRFMECWLGKKYKKEKFYWREFNNLGLGIFKHIKGRVVCLNYIRFWVVYSKFLKLVLREKVLVNRKKQKIWKKLRLKLKFLWVKSKKNYNFFYFGLKRRIILVGEKYKKLKCGIFYLINLSKKYVIKKVKGIFDKKYGIRFLRDGLKKKKTINIKFIKNKVKKRDRFYKKVLKAYLVGRKKIISSKTTYAYIVRTKHNIFITGVRYVNKVAFVFSSGRSIKYAKKGFRKIVRSKRATHFSAKLLSRQAKKYAIKIRYKFGQIRIRNKRSGLLRCAAKDFVYGVWFDESLVQFILPHNGMKKKKKKRV